MAVTDMQKHWTEKTVDDFLYRIGFDFVRQIESLMEAGVLSQKELASNLGVT
jgi:hypothetical protein